MANTFHGFHRLSTGNLSMLYKKGEIRQVQYGDTCILHGIYAAVRDRNWGTLIPLIKNEEIREREGGFTIGLDLRYESSEILFRARTEIGVEGESLWFNFEGSAERNFLRNRIGICVLHPIDECRGKPVRVIHPDGSVSQGHFPDLISPHQPLMNVSGMVWSPRKGMEGELGLQGEIFEMEDQRNWTDASYKTYGTPLEIPFPAPVEKGTVINQRADLRVRAPRISGNGKPKEVVTIHPEKNSPLSFPAIGVSRRPDRRSMSVLEGQALRQAGFSHLRADLRLAMDSWLKTFEQIRAEQRILERPVELALHLTDRADSELDAFLDAYRAAPLPLARILVFDQQSLSVAEWVPPLISRIREHLPGIPVGGGSDAHFTELNRNRPEAGSLDYICYTICPQVHAFDNLTLVENIRAQPETVKSARALSGLPVAVTAVSLKERFNPVATEPDSLSDQAPGSDRRQHTLFGAGWTLACLSALAGTGAISLTLYETEGPRGILNGIEEGHPRSPQFHLLKDLLQGEQLRYLPTCSGDPLKVTCLMVEDRTGSRIYLANHTETECRVDISGLTEPPGQRDSSRSAALHPGGWKVSAASVHPPGILTLGPFEVLKFVK